MLKEWHQSSATDRWPASVDAGAYFASREQRASRRAAGTAAPGTYLPCRAHALGSCSKEPASSQRTASVPVRSGDAPLGRSLAPRLPDPRSVFS